PAILICPGGAYLRIAEREAVPIANRFMQLGFQPFLLRYSTGARFPAPLIQLGAAIASIRQKADLWSLYDRFIAVCGFSAGGHLASYYAAAWESAGWAGVLGLPLDLLRPDAIVLGYPVIDLTSLTARRLAIGNKVVDLPEAML